MQLVVGRIGRPHGLRGEVTVEVRTDDPDERFAPGTVLATDPPARGPLTVATARWHKGTLLLGIEGCESREAAESLRDTMIVVDSGDVAPSDDPDEFHDSQLIGLAVVTAEGERIGEVADVLHHGQDLLVVRRPSRDNAYVPFVKALVPEVDLDKGVLVVAAPPGLFDLDE